MNTLVFGLDSRASDYLSQSSSKLSKLVGENTGNLVFTYAIHKHLKDYQVLSWEDNSLDNATDAKVCIIPSANFIGKHANMAFLYEKLRNFSKPIILLGLGVQASSQAEHVEIPSGTKQMLHLVADSVTNDQPNIGARGYFTKNVLREMGINSSVEVTGCPSNFISPLPDLGSQIANNCTNIFDRVAVCSSHVRWSYLRKAEHDLYKIMEETGGIYINQSPSAMISTGIQDLSVLTTELSEELVNHTKPSLSISELPSHIKRYYRSYFCVEDWMASVRRCSLVIGARIHGCMVAIQAGMPSICVAHDARTEELCQIMNIPHFVRSEVQFGISRDMISEKLLSFDWSAYDRRRGDLLSKYCNIFSCNSIPASNHLMQLAQKMRVNTLA